MHKASLMSRHSEQHLNGLHLSNKCGYLIVVDPLLLDVALRHKLSFVLNNGPLFVMLQLEDPLQANWMMA